MAKKVSETYRIEMPSEAAATPRSGSGRRRSRIDVADSSPEPSCVPAFAHRPLMSNRFARNCFGVFHIGSAPQQSLATHSAITLPGGPGFLPGAEDPRQYAVKTPDGNGTENVETRENMAKAPVAFMSTNRRNCLADKHFSNTLAR